jgi:hypothetical protein
MTALRPWSQDGSGQSRVESAAVARELAVNAAYRDKLAFWFPNRGAAQIAFMDRVSDDGAQFDVVRILPEGGPAIPVLDQQRNPPHRTAGRARQRRRRGPNI